MAKLVDEICSMTGKGCRFCSNEVQRDVVRYSAIRDCELGKKGETGQKTRRIELGSFCNNVSKYVKDLKYCPAQWALTRPGKPLTSTKPEKKPEKPAKSGKKK